jgi:hypothetical protein
MVHSFGQSSLLPWPSRQEAAWELVASIGRVSPFIFTMSHFTQLKALTGNHTIHLPLALRGLRSNQLPGHHQLSPFQPCCALLGLRRTWFHKTADHLCPICDSSFLSLSLYYTLPVWAFPENIAGTNMADIVFPTSSPKAARSLALSAAVRASCQHTAGLTTFPAMRTSLSPAQGWVPEATPSCVHSSVSPER